MTVIAASGGNVYDGNLSGGAVPVSPDALTHVRAMINVGLSCGHIAGTTGLPFEWIRHFAQTKSEAVPGR
jgi:hypothetical protein